jgi:hypothetical protein
VFVATAVNVYAWPFVNPVNVQVVAGDVIVQVNAPGEEVTVNVDAGPDVVLSVAAVTATVICVLPAEPEIATVGTPAFTGVHCAYKIVSPYKVTEAPFTNGVPDPLAAVFHPAKV